MAQDEKSKRLPALPPHYDTKKDEEITSMSTDEEFHNQEANVDVIYVNNDRKMKIFTSESESDLNLEYGTEQSVDVGDEPPPLPIKNKHKQNVLFDEKQQYQIIDGVYVFKNVSTYPDVRELCLQIEIMKICMGTCNTQYGVQPGSSEILTEYCQKLHSIRKSNVNKITSYIY